ncbi:MAG: VTT domain-containing protein, partial [Planctomycetes bacterium]|nr:VTT domain-containing protein [Planctomycetota bacterium]
TLTVSAGSTLGAALCFLVARHFARNATARWLSRSARFRRIDALTARHGALMVALTRLIPFFPYNMTNFAFGVTSVRLRTYVFWSWLCMIPATFIFVAGGDLLGDLLVHGFRRESVDLQVLTVLALDLVLVALVAALARRRVREDGAAPGTGPGKEAA